MKSPEEFWSKRQHTDSSAMESWVLARQRVGKSSSLALLSNFRKPSNPLKFQANNTVGVTLDHAFLKRHPPPFCPTISELLTLLSLNIGNLITTSKRPQPLWDAKATITSKRHITDWLTGPLPIKIKVNDSLHKTKKFWSPIFICNGLGKCTWSAWCCRATFSILHLLPSHLYCNIVCKSLLHYESPEVFKKSPLVTTAVRILFQTQKFVLLKKNKTSFSSHGFL